MEKVQATQIAFDTVIDGHRLRAGDWLVIHEDGRKQVVSDEEWRAQGGHPQGLVDRPSRALARRGGTEIGAHRPGSSLRRMIDGGERDREGGAEIMTLLPGGLGPLVKNSMDPNVKLRALAVIDDETGEVVAMRNVDVNAETDRRPTVERIEVNAKGEVERVHIKPEEWPPRRGNGETF